MSWNAPSAPWVVAATATAMVGSMVRPATASTSAESVSRSTSSRSRALKASIVWAAL